MHSVIASRTSLIGLVALALTLGGSAEARNRTKSAPQTVDSIDPVGHIALKADTATRMLMGEHWRRNYVYVELSSRPVLLQVDVTDPAKPHVIAELPLPAKPETHVDTVVGSAVLITDVADTQPAAAPKVPRTIQLLSFADPAHPTTVRQFANLTGFAKDESRGLIYLFNDEGFWVLQQKPAPDLELIQQYEHEVLYNH